MSVGQYVIPANCLVFSMLHHIMRDEQHWNPPLQFRPERFLPQGKVVKEERFIPFGVGAYMGIL